MRPRGLLAFGNFFSVAHFYLIIFILAPYLATFMPEEQTGLIISAGALATLAIFPSASKLVARYGAQRLAVYLGTAETILLVLLAVNPVPVVAMILAALAVATSPFIAYGLDLLLEATVKHSEESSTGRIRSAYLTAGNVALISAPIVTGFLLDGDNAYYRVFLVAALSLLPFILLFGFNQLPHGLPPARTDLRKTLVCIRRTPDLYSIIGANAILQFFYHLAPLYIPLYLHNVLGIPWGTLGWMFAAMLVPFVLIEYPAGVVADRKLGDRILLGIGFVITGVSFAFIAFLTTTTSLTTILVILIGTRIGAALIESMVEGHFFRRVSEQDTETVGVFRMARPFSALFAPLIGSVVLAIGGYYSLFVFSGGVILIAGMVATFGIKDIKLVTDTSPSIPQPSPLS